MKSGLVTKQQALKAKTANKKQKKQAVKTGEMTDAERHRAKLKEQQKALADKDRELNRELEEKRQKKAIKAQVQQLIDKNTVIRSKGDIGYNFVVNNKVKKIYVTEEMQSKLSLGLLAIAVQGDSYKIIPVPVAHKIAERMPEIIILQNQNEPNLSEEEQDWYADYDIPDDLMW